MMPLSPNRSTLRRPVLSAIGSGDALVPPVETLCVELGRRAVEAGFRIVTGGLGGVMEAVSKGARNAATYREGDIVGLLPSYDRNMANPHVDIVLPTGLGIGRNILVVAAADVVAVIGGGSGTLSEVAIAWQLGKSIIALSETGGWATRLADEQVDDRRSDRVHRARTAHEAIEIAVRLWSDRRPG